MQTRRTPADTFSMPAVSPSTAGSLDLLSTQEIEIDQYYRYSRLSALLAIGVHMLFGVAGLVIGAPQLTILQVVSVAVYAASFLVHRSRSRRFWILILLVYLDLVVHSTLAGWIVGHAAGFQYYTWILLPLLFTNVNRTLRAKVVLSFVYVAMFMAIDAWLRHTTPLTHIDPLPLAAMRYFNMGCFFLALGVAAWAHSATIQQAEERLRSAAGTDALTRLMNRRRMAERITEEVARAQRSNAPLTVILLDIDRFKSINDDFGHIEGDRVISHVADVLRTGVRKVDMVARWGGEEFLVLLPDTDVQAAAELAERIRRKVAARVARHASTQECVTVTAGVATLRLRETIESTIHRADLALYQGKRSGRDRVVVADGDVAPESRAVARG